MREATGSVAERINLKAAAVSTAFSLQPFFDPQNVAPFLFFPVMNLSKLTDVNRSDWREYLVTEA